MASPSTPVSVIIPTHNRAGFLSRAIDSVLAQTYSNFELIVVDDGSTDATQALLASYGKALVTLRQENRGPAAARNAGIRAARHSLLAFLDSDDQFTRNKLFLQAAAMEAQPDLLISHTQETWFCNGQHRNQKKRHAKEGGDIFARSLELCVVGMSTVMVRRELFERIGLLDESFPCCEDYELWLRASVGHSFLLVEAPLTVKHGGRQDQVSMQFRTGMDRFRLRAIEKLLSSSPLTSAQFRLASEELVRKAVLYGNGCLKHGRSEEGHRARALAARYSPLV
ncbi:glycosyltransferase family 2 protein [Thiovibrio frasassiensis]|uniref:Glycosyltransferase family 2 protein n=1 Tax=Thiovibrio frasassiensis TaxID=2984131 RepID=A0A9X4MFK0_9BACT|nr:glycosyltransferase family A protein [Thiovibrio frasassiensis]MDG4474568.1 glycosyltransferase family 2 protein [Thiovibrio frasassiensis]